MSCLLILKVAPASEVGPASRYRSRTAQKNGSVGHDAIEQHLGRFPHQDVIAVEQGNDRIRCLFNTDDMIRIQEHGLSVKPGDQDHGSLRFFGNSSKQRKKVKHFQLVGRLRDVRSVQHGIYRIEIKVLFGNCVN